MKKFFTKLVVFALPIILIMYVADVYISVNLKKSNDFAGQEYPTWNAILEGQLDSEILIYGSSRAWVHFDPEIIQDSLKLSAFNLGIDGHNFNMQNLRHKLALKYNEKPKLIIHSVDATTLEKKGFYNSEQILPYMLWEEDFFQSTADYDMYSFLDYNMPLLRYYGKTDAIEKALKMNLQLEKNPQQRVRGYKGQERTWNADFEKAKRKMNAFVVNINQEVLQMFDLYLKECKAQNIEVVLVYAPVHVVGQDFIENEEILDSTYKALTKKYDFLYLDFKNDELCKDKAYFYNSRHLNKHGAELFTAKCVKEIKEQIPSIISLK